MPPRSEIVGISAWNSGIIMKMTYGEEVYIVKEKTARSVLV